MSSRVELASVAEIRPRLPKGLEDSQAVSFLSMSSVSEDARLLDEEERTLGECRKGYTYFERGDVLVAKITPCFENGKAVHLQKLAHPIGFGSTEFHVIRPKPSVLDGRYLFYLLWNPLFRRYGEAKMSGSAGQKRVPVDVLKKYKIPLPPLKEQKRIAAILDKADAIRRKRQQAIHLTDQLLRSVFLDMFGDIPAKKSRYPFGTCREFVKAQSGKSSKAVISARQTPIPIYGGNGINGFATEALFDEPVIVVGRVGQQCGITILTKGSAWVTDNAIVVRVIDDDRLDAAYLASAFQHSPIRDTVTRLDLPFVNQPMLLDYEIPLPPIEAQIHYRRLRTRTLRQRDEFASNLETTKSLYSSLVQKFFPRESMV